LNQLRLTTLQRIKEDIERHEGNVPYVYLDHLGYKTMGIGHLIRQSEPEYLLKVGQGVSKEAIDEYFENDLRIAIDDARRIFGDLNEHPQDVIRVLVNMSFNLGYPRLNKFVKMKQAIAQKNYLKAADEMKDSRWYTQVGRRGPELFKLMSEADL
jgi:lysozyme